MYENSDHDVEGPSPNTSVEVVGPPGSVRSDMEVTQSLPVTITGTDPTETPGTDVTGSDTVVKGGID